MSKFEGLAAGIPMAHQGHNRATYTGTGRTKKYYRILINKRQHIFLTFCEGNFLAKLPKIS